VQRRRQTAAEVKAEDPSGAGQRAEPRPGGRTTSMKIAVGMNNSETLSVKSQYRLQSKYGTTAEHANDAPVES